MTKKDYELIAESLRCAGPSTVLPVDIDPSDVYIYRKGRGHAWRNTCLTMADRLALANPLFSRKKFLELCGVDER